MSTKNLLRLFIPPIAYKLKNKLFSKEQTKEYQQEHKSGWFGNYTSWNEAQKDSEGYDSDIILQKVKTALQKVKTGKAVYERDSVLFDKKEYSEYLIKGMLKASAENHNKLHVLDFGGSLGSSYYQNKAFFEHLKEFSWNIVEQEKFVKEGKRTFENDTLKFYDSINDAINETAPNVLLLSSVLQYLEEPYRLIEEILQNNFAYIIIDRTSFLHSHKHKITKQIVPDSIYKASYPCHFFVENNFLQKFQDKYDMISEFRSYCDPLSYILNNQYEAYWMGYVFKLKK
jgi:putative methyltransferase (TIGR04325 family)